MKWIIRIYLLVGIVKAVVAITSRNPSSKPAWMRMEKDPFAYVFSLAIFILLWPLSR